MTSQGSSISNRRAPSSDSPRYSRRISIRFLGKAILAGWRAEISDPEVEDYVAVSDSGRTVGFAATAGSELLHFGTAIGTWGDGTASALHDVVVGLLRSREGQPSLFVFADNGRGRRFYDKHGWQPSGATRTGTFPPYPLLLEYTLQAR